LNNHKRLLDIVDNRSGFKIAKVAGFTFTNNGFDAFIPWKYLVNICCFIPIYAVNIPIGSFEKVITIEKLNEEF
jgi:hypothetical protein